MAATATRENTKKTQINPDDTRERRLEIMSLLKEGDKVFWTLGEKFGVYKGIQDLPMPSAWVLFDNKRFEEPINPFELILQPIWKEGDKVVHTLLKKEGVVIKVTGLHTIIEFDSVKDWCEIHGEGYVELVSVEAESNNEIESQPSYQEVVHAVSPEEKTTLDELLLGSACIVPSPLVESVEGANNWINLFSGQSLNSQDYKIAWIKAPVQQIAKELEIPEDFAGEALSREEVEKLIEKIVETSESIKSLALFAKNFTRYALVVIDAREGYKAYECDSMSQFLENYSYLFKKAYSSLQKEWQAGRLEYDLGFKIGTLPETQARELYPLRDNIDDCLKAWESACEKAESENRRVKSADIGIAVREITNSPEPPKKIRTKCGWVAGPNAARHYVVKIFNSEINLHDTYDAAARMIIDLAEARKQAPEGLIVEGLIGALAEVLGVSHAGAVASAVDFLKRKEAA